jgi:hypothetical protein
LRRLTVYHVGVAARAGLPGTLPPVFDVDRDNDIDLAYFAGFRMALMEW